MVISYALMENENEGNSGVLVSMEELPYYMEMSKSLLPDFLKRFVEFKQSDRIMCDYHIFTGTAYKDIPKRDYELGPYLKSIETNEETFNFDLLNIVKWNQANFLAILDRRLSSHFVYQLVFGRSRVRYNPIKDIVFLKDLRSVELPALDTEFFYNKMLEESTLTRY